MLPKFTEQVAEQAADKSASTTPYTKPSFVARVMLHYAPEGYSKLHEAMEAKGFEQTITGHKSRGSKRVTSKLPGGMYYYNASSSQNQFRSHTLATIYKAVKEVVESVVKGEGKEAEAKNTPPTVIIIESNSVKWEGLEDA